MADPSPEMMKGQAIVGIRFSSSSVAAAPSASRLVLAFIGPVTFLTFINNS